MRVMLLTALLVTALGMPVLADHPGVSHPSRPASSVTSTADVFMMVGAPGRGGRIIGVTRLDAAATADMQAATHAEVRHGTRGFVFAVARVAAEGQPVGTTLLTVTGGARTMADVAAQLRAAASGTTTLVIFTSGRGREGVVTALFAASQLQARTRVALNGATHVTILAGGRDETFAIVSSGETAATIQVAAGAAAGVEAGASGLLDLLIGLRP